MNGLENIPSFGDVDAESAADLAALEAIKATRAPFDWAPPVRTIPIETPAPQAQSSIQIEDAAKGPPRITTKFYVGSRLDQGDLEYVLEAHAYMHRRAAEMAMNDWQLTVAQLKELGK